MEPIVQYQSKMTTSFKNFRRQVLFWEYLPLLILVIITLILHFMAINTPATVVGDGYWYVEEAKSILNGQGALHMEHPPLAKLLIAGGIELFGDNPFGWRFFSVIFGTIGIILFYFLCRKTNMSRTATYIATFLLATENLYFVQSSIAMLDIFMVTFVLAGLLLYLHRGYMLSAMAIALAALCKFNGIFIICAILLHWLLVRRDKPLMMLLSVISTGIFFLVFMIPFEYIIWDKLVDPIARVIQIFQITAVNKFTDPPLFISSHPWNWLLPWIGYDYSAPSLQYLAFISWTVQIMIIPAVVYMVYKFFKGNNAAILGVAWFISTYISLVAMTIISNRVTYIFYFLPTIGTICLGIGLAISDFIDKVKTRVVLTGRITFGMKTSYVFIAIYLLLHLAFFLIVNPGTPLGLRQTIAPYLVEKLTPIYETFSKIFGP